MSQEKITPAPACVVALRVSSHAHRLICAPISLSLCVRCAQQILMDDVMDASAADQETNGWAPSTFEIKNGSFVLAAPDGECAMTLRVTAQQLCCVCAYVHVKDHPVVQDVSAHTRALKSPPRAPSFVLQTLLHLLQMPTAPTRPPRSSPG